MEEIFFQPQIPRSATPWPPHRGQEGTQRDDDRQNGGLRAGDVKTVGSLSSASRQQHGGNDGHFFM